MITVRELIKLLKECDPKMNVCLATDECGYHMHDFFELRYDDVNIYLIPMSEQNKYWGKRQIAIHEDLEKRFGNNREALLEEINRYTPET